MGRFEEMAEREARKFTSRDGTDITFEATDSPPTVVTIKGMATAHHARYDNYMDSGSMGGVGVNSRRATVTVAEQLLTAAGYPVRNDDGDVNLKNHKVSWTDSAGINRGYIVSEWLPDEAVGLITVVLGGLVE